MSTIRECSNPTAPTCWYIYIYQLSNDCGVSKGKKGYWNFQKCSLPTNILTHSPNCPNQDTATSFSFLSLSLSMSARFICTTCLISQGQTRRLESHRLLGELMQQRTGQVETTRTCHQLQGHFYIGIYIYRNYLNIHTHMHTCRPSPVTHYPFHSCNLVRKLHGIWDHQPELRQWLLKYLFKPLTFPPKSFAMMCRPNNHTQITSFWHNNKIGQKKSIIDGFSVSLKGNLGMKEIKTLAKKNKRHLRYSMHGIIMYIWSISWCMQVNIPIQNEHLGTQTPMFGLRIWSEATNHPTLTEV